jgi:hypothetical protein
MSSPPIVSARVDRVIVACAGAALLSLWLWVAAA